MSHKVVLIGLDGGTYRVLNPLMEEGRLPNIARLIKNGGHGTLLSTIPPVTAPAWTSLLTGKNPGKHGIFNFLKMVAKEYTTKFYDWHESALVNATDIPSKTLWELAGEGGRKVGMVNMPMTYPPMPLNGFMISCLLTPPGAKQFTYPKEMAFEIPDYKIDLNCGRGYGQVTPAYVKDFSKFFSELTDVMDQRAGTILHLMKSRPWDLLMPVFTETDRMHHYFWRCIDKADPFYETYEGKAQRTLFTQVYQRLDAHIGSIVQAAGDAVILIVSDHGFTSGAKCYFNLNAWLRENGYLFLDGDPAQGWFSRAKGGLLSRFISRPLPLAGSSCEVSWGRTSAWGIPYLARTGGIKINVKDEMKQGVIQRGNGYNKLVQKIKAGIQSIKDSNGQPIVETVYLRDELYRGEFASNAPDILFTLYPQYDIPLNFQADVSSTEMISPMQNVFLTGNHEREGIIVISGGPAVAGKVLPAAGIESVAPTILYLLGLPVPEDMDGVVIRDAIAAEYLKAHPVSYGPAQTSGNRRKDLEDLKGWQSNEDMEGVKARLRGLGYME